MTFHCLSLPFPDFSSLTHYHCLQVAATATIGPVTEHFANQASNGGHSLDYGLAASFTAVPAGFTIETALTVSSAVAPSAAAASPVRASVPAGGVNAALFE